MSQRMIEVILFLGALLLALLTTHAYLVSRSEEQKLQATLTSQNQVIADANSRQQQRDSTLASTLADLAKQKAAKQSPQELADALAKFLALPQPIRLVRDAVSSANPTTPTFAQNAYNPASNRSPLGRTPPDNPDALPGPGIRGAAGKSSPGEWSPLSLPVTDSAHSSARPGLSGLVAGLSLTPDQSSDPSPTPGGLPRAKSAPCQPSSECSTVPQDADLPAADLKPLYNYVLDCRACQAQLAAAKQDAADATAKITALTRERNAAVTAVKGGSWLQRLRRNAVWFAAGAAIGYAASHR